MKRKVKDLEDCIVDWEIKNNKQENTSKLHELARSIIAKCFISSLLYEEVSIPVEKYKKYRLDFFLPELNLAIEVQGEQHEKFNNFFYSSKLEFAKARGRDLLKKQWCDINNITMIYFSYKETKDQWKNKLQDLL